MIRAALPKLYERRSSRERSRDPTLAALLRPRRRPAAPPAPLLLPPSPLPLPPSRPRRPPWRGGAPSPFPRAPLPLAPPSPPPARAARRCPGGAGGGGSSLPRRPGWRRGSPYWRRCISGGEGSAPVGWWQDDGGVPAAGRCDLQATMSGGVRRPAHAAQIWALGPNLGQGGPVDLLRVLQMKERWRVSGTAATAAGLL